MDILGTQENDHPEWIHKRLRRRVGMVKLKKYNKHVVSNSLKFLMKREKHEGGGGKDPSYCRGDRQNDTVTIYYNTRTVFPMKHTAIPISNDKNKGKTFVGLVHFRHIATGRTFHVVCGHLKSGEKKNDAAKRLRELEMLMLGLTKHNNPISDTVMLMDSNSSYKYESAQGGFGDDVQTFLEGVGFSDLLKPERGTVTGNECFKMRHGSGGQPGKFGALMLDQIDKIVIRGSVTGRSVGLPKNTPFKKFNTGLTAVEKQHLLSVRDNTNDLRNQLQKIVTNERWSNRVGEQRGAPTRFTNDTNGQKIALNWDPLYKPLKNNPILSQKLQKRLYPSMSSPSDHPPCLAVIELPPKGKVR